MQLPVVAAAPHALLYILHTGYTYTHLNAEFFYLFFARKNNIFTHRLTRVTREGYQHNTGTRVATVCVIDNNGKKKKILALMRHVTASSMFWRHKLFVVLSSYVQNLR